MSFLIGLIAGVFGGLVGLGGGAIMIPLVVRFKGLSQHQAHGTSLMALVFTGLSGAITYYLNGSVDVLAAVLLAASAIFTASLGALSANALPEWQLKRAFGIFLILVSVILVAKPYLGQFSQSTGGWIRVVAILFSGAVAGFLSGMMGVGGGSIMVPALVLLAGLGQHTAQGSSLLAMVPAGSVGAVTHWRLGNVVGGLLPGLIIGILLGTYLGATGAHFLTDANLRVVFAVVLIWLGLRDIRASGKMHVLKQD
ncbi:MAG: sulfite exporter TauE/SafE family protein [Thermodesulfobacteriota bacterium]